MKWTQTGKRWRYELYYMRAPGGYELIVKPHQGMFAVSVRLWNAAGQFVFETTAARYYETLTLAKAAAVRLWKRVAKEQAT